MREKIRFKSQESNTTTPLECLHMCDIKDNNKNASKNINKKYCKLGEIGFQTFVTNPFEWLHAACHLTFTQRVWDRDILKKKKESTITKRRKKKITSRHEHKNVNLQAFRNTYNI